MCMQCSFDFLRKKPSCLLRKPIKNSNSIGYYWQHGREMANLHAVVQIINVNIRIFADKQLIRGKKIYGDRSSENSLQKAQNDISRG